MAGRHLHLQQWVQHGAAVQATPHCRCKSSCEQTALPLAALLLPLVAEAGAVSNSSHKQSTDNPLHTTAASLAPLACQRLESTKTFTSKHLPRSSSCKVPITGLWRGRDGSTEVAVQHCARSTFLHSWIAHLCTKHACHDCSGMMVEVLRRQC